MLHDFIPLITALFWPATILILVFYFRKGIKNLIISVTEARIGDSVFFKFGQAGSDTPNEPTSVPKQISAPSAVKWENTGNLFWLGDDLQWTAQTVLRGAPKGKILHGLKQCHHHASELGLEGSPPGKVLSSLKSDVESLPESALDRLWRDNFAARLEAVIGGFGILSIDNQTNFRARPES